MTPASLSFNEQTAQLRVNIAAYEKALLELRDTQQRLQQALHSPHPDEGLGRVIEVFKMKLMGDQVRLKRLELLGR